MIDQSCPRFWQGIKFASKRHDAMIDLDAGQFGEAVGLKSGANDQGPRAPAPLGGRNFNGVRVFVNGNDFGAELDIGSLSRDDFGKGRGDHFVVDDPGRRHEQSGEPCDIGLELHEADVIDPFSGDAVLLGALEESLHMDALAIIGGDEKLAAIFEFYAVFHAESLSRGSAFAAKSGLQTSRRIINARMDDPAVVPGLMAGNGGFFFQNNDRGTRPCPQNFAGGRQADNPSANNCKIIGHWFGAKSLVRIRVELAKLEVLWMAVMSSHSQASSTHVKRLLPSEHRYLRQLPRRGDAPAMMTWPKQFDTQLIY